MSRRIALYESLNSRVPYLSSRTGRQAAARRVSRRIARCIQRIGFDVRWGRLYYSQAMKASVSDVPHRLRRPVGAAGVPA